MNETDDIPRQLPHALGPEKSVLSTLIKEPWRIDETPLDPDVFYLPAHQRLYEAMRRAGEGLELTSFVESLYQSGNLDAIGGSAAISDIYTYATTAQHLDRHLEIIRDRHGRRMAITASLEAAEAAYDCFDDQDSQTLTEALTGPFTAVVDYLAGTGAVRDTKAIAREFIAAFEARVSGDQTEPGQKTGISEIDQYLRGMKPQHFGVISARTSGGKSTLGTQIAGYMAEPDYPVLYLILERTEASAFERAVIQRSGVNHSMVTQPWRNMPDKGSLMKIKRETKHLSECFHLRKPPNRNLATILAEIRRYHRKHGIKAVFLDQIGLVRGERSYAGNREEELRSISNTLQELAQQLKISVAVMSQLNAFGDTKGATAIEEDADWHLSIVQEMDRKKANFRQHLHVLIAKDSHHSSGGERLPLILDTDVLKFVHGVPDIPEENKDKYEPRVKKK